MNAIEQTTPASEDRRGAPRMRLGGKHPILIGRGDGVVMDVSETGARVRHSTATRRGERIRLSLEWEGERFSAHAEVLACRVVSIGNGGGTTFESRLRFVSMPPGAAEVLQRTMQALQQRDMRRWVANLRGWGSEDERGDEFVNIASSLVRYRLCGNSWEKKCTTNGVQPDDGFVVPADVDESEVATLCRTYQGLDRDGRRIVRLMAAEVVAHVVQATQRHASIRPR
jgi:hypothetical protein